MTFKKYYLCSEVFDSSQIPSELKEILDRERSTYRRKVPTVSLTEEDISKAREIVKTTEVVPMVDENGEICAAEVEFSEYDVPTWRYFFIPETLEDLEKFIDEVGVGVEITPINPEDLDDEDVTWAEGNIGMPLPEEEFVIMTATDGFLWEEMLRGGEESEENA